MVPTTLMDRDAEHVVPEAVRVRLRAALRLAVQEPLRVRDGVAAELTDPVRLGLGVGLPVAAALYVRVGVAVAEAAGVGVGVGDAEGDGVGRRLPLAVALDAVAVVEWVREAVDGVGVSETLDDAEQERVPLGVCVRVASRVADAVGLAVEAVGLAGLAVAVGDRDNVPERDRVAVTVGEDTGDEVNVRDALP